MTILDWKEFLTSGATWQPLAATVGVFDGLHLGHRALISKVTRRSPGMHSAVFTFRENPKRFLHPKTFHGDLYSLEGKLGLIRETGVELCVLIDFSSDFGKLSGSEFLSSLRDAGGLQYIAVGSDFRCGYKLDTDAAALAILCVESGVESEILGPVNWNGKPISSSRIRKAILEGKLTEAGSMLGRPYGIDCTSSPCTRIAEGRFSLHAPDLAIVPPPGKYAVDVEWQDRRYPGTAELVMGHWVIETAMDAGPSALYFIDKVSRE